MQYVNLTEFAKIVGVSKQAVSEAVKNGRIKTNPEGLLDKDKALRDWNRNKEVESQRMEQIIPDKRWSNLLAKLGLTPEDMATLPGYADVKIIRELINTQKDKIELDKELGKVVPIDILHSHERELARLVKTEILNIPKRIVNQLSLDKQTIKTLESLLISEINSIAQRIDELNNQ